MRDYRDVRKRVFALLLAGVLLSTTIGPDLFSLAEGANGCDGFVDAVTYDGGTLVAGAEGDGLCDKCGRVAVDHSAPEPAPAPVVEENPTEEPEPEAIEETEDIEDDNEPQDEDQPEADLHAHIDEDEDGICDECGLEIMPSNPEDETNPEDNPDKKDVEETDNTEDAAGEEKTEEEKIIEEYEENDGDEECVHDYIYVGKGDGTHIIICKKCGKEFIANCYLNDQGWCEVCGVYTDPASLVVAEEQTENESELVCEHEYTYTYNGEGTHTKKCMHCDEEAIIEPCEVNDQGWCALCGEFQGEEICEHEFEYVGNGDKTHRGTCKLCGEIIDEDCTFEEYISDEEGRHKAVCTVCGHEISEECEYNELGYCYYCGFNKEDLNKIKLTPQTFSKSFANVTVTVSGLIPEGGWVDIISISNNYAEHIINENSGQERNVLEAFDINVFDADGNIYQPVDDGNTLSVTFSGVKGLSKAVDSEIFRIEDNNSVSQISSTVYGDNVTFNAEHFTIYTITELNNEDAYDTMLITGPTKVAFITSSQTDYKWVNGTEFKVKTDENNVLVRYGVSVYRDITDLSNPESGTRILEKTGTKTITSEGVETIIVGIEKGDYTSGQDIYLGSGVNYAVIVSLDIENQTAYGLCKNLYGNINYVSKLGNPYEAIQCDGMIKESTEVEARPSGISSILIQSTNSVISNNSIVYTTESEDTLRAVLTPALNRTVTWSVSNTEVLTIDSNGKLTFKKPGNVTITASVVNGDASKTHTINVSVYSATLNQSSYVYTGQEIKPTVTLNTGTATNLTYSNNTDATTAAKVAFQINGYDFEKTFTIERMPLNVSFFSNAVFNVTSKGVVNSVTGAKDSSNNSLVKDKDYTVELINKSVSDTGITFTAKITGINNYKDVVNVDDIKASDKPDISTAIKAAWMNNYKPSVYYTGSPILLASLTAGSYAGINAISLKYSDNTNASGIKDKLTVRLENNTNAGEASVFLSMPNTYTGELELNFTIKPIDAESNVDTVWKAEDEITYPSTVTKKGSTVYFEHTGSAITPDDYGDNHDDFIKVTYGAITLTKGTDYTISYSNNINLSSSYAHVIIDFQGNYEGTKELDFKINPKLEMDATVTLNGSFIANASNGWDSGYQMTYTGDTDVKPYSVVVKNYKETVSVVSEKTGSDGLILTYADDENGGTFSPDVGSTGTKYILLTGYGKYSGKKLVVKYYVTPVDLENNDNVTMTQDKTEFEYDGTAHEGKFTLKYNGKSLTSNDYEISNITGDTVNVTTSGFTYTIAGKGNFTGTLSMNCKITPLSLSKSNMNSDHIVKINDSDKLFSVDLAGLNNGEIEYTGEAIEPAVEILLGTNSTPLSADNHFDVEYKNNENVGNAKCIITGKGNLTGSIELTFKITALKNTTYEILLNGVQAEKVDNAHYTCDGYKPVYNGAKIQPTVSVSVNGKSLKYNTNYSLIFAGNTHATSTANQNSGTYARIDLSGNYNGTIFVYYNIQPRDITASTVSVTAPSVVDYDASRPATYYPTPIEVKEVSNELKLANSTKVLVLGTDYTVNGNIAGNNLTTAGAGKKFVITGTGDYTGTIEKTYAVGQDLTNIRANNGISLKDPNRNTNYDSINDQYQVTYISKTRPVETIVVGGRTLVQGTDYTISYAVGNDTGDATYQAGNVVTASITGKGAYYGTTSFTYLIKPADISNMKTSDSNVDNNSYYFTYSDSKVNAVSKPGYYYNGKMQDVTPNVTIKYMLKKADGTSVAIETLSNTNDISFKSDVSANSGEIGINVRETEQPDANGNDAYFVDIAAKSSNYTGSVSNIRYSLRREWLSATTITVISDKNLKWNATKGKYEVYYTGKKIQLSDEDFKVTLNGMTLKYGTDYTIEISSSAIGTDVEAKFRGISGSNFNADAGFKVFPFDIIAVDLATDENIEVSVNKLRYKNAQYTVDDFKKADANLIVKYDGETLTRGENASSGDYYISAVSTGNTLPEKSDGTKYTSNWVEITASSSASGNIFAGTKRIYFEIYLDISDPNLVKVELDHANKLYDVGKAPQISIKYKVGDNTYKSFDQMAGGTSEYNYKVSVDYNSPGQKDITIEGFDDGLVNCGTGNVIIQNVSFRIDLSTNGASYAKLTKTNFPYNGEDVYFSNVKYKNYLEVVGELGIDYTIDEYRDYQLSGYSKNVGHKTVVIKATDTSRYYTKSYTLDFYVKYDLSQATKLFVYKAGKSYATLTEDNQFDYAEKEFKHIDDFLIGGQFGSDIIDLSTTNGGYITVSCVQKIESPGTYNLTITPASDKTDMVMGSKSTTLKVLGRKFDDASIDVKIIKDNNPTDPALYETTYTGYDQFPEVGVYIKGKQTKLVLDTDYTIEFVNNLNASTNSEKATIKVTGEGAYENNTIEKYFTINKKDITDSDVSINLKDTTYAGNNVEITPEAEIKYNGWDLKPITASDPDGQYRIISVEQNGFKIPANKEVNQITCYITAEGSRNFKGTTGNLSLNVQKLDINAAAVQIKNQSVEWNGKEYSIAQICPSAEDSDEGLIITVNNGGVTTLLVQGQDFEVEKDYGVVIRDVGVYQLKIKPLNNCKCTTTKTVDFSITPRSIAKNWASNGRKKDGTASTIQITVPNCEIFESGKENKPIGDITITDSGVDPIYKNLDSDSFEVVGYGRCTESGGAAYSTDSDKKDKYGNYEPAESSPYVIIRGKGNYNSEETIKVAYSVGKDINTVVSNAANVNYIHDYYYNGVSQIPTLEIKTNKGITLKKDKHYTVEVKDEDTISAGEKELIITGIGEYFGVLYSDVSNKSLFTYRINKRDLKNGYNYTNKYVGSDLKTEVPTNDMTVRFNVDLSTIDLTLLKTLTNREKYEAYTGYYYAKYANAEIRPAITITDSGLATKTQVVDPENYDIEYYGADAGTQTSQGLNYAEIKFKNNYVSDPAPVFRVYYMVLETQIGDSFEIDWLDNTKIFNWDGNPVEPNINVVSGGLTLKKDIDYKISYVNDDEYGNIAPGMGKIVVTGINKYAGEVSDTFTIRCDITKTSVVTKKESAAAIDPDDPSTFDVVGEDNELPDQFYTGKEIEPEFEIILLDAYGKNKNMLLEKNVDYLYSVHSDDNYESTGKVIITGQQPYFGEVENGNAEETKKVVTFNIVLKKEMLCITNYESEYKYTGEEIRPDFKLATKTGQDLSDGDYIKNIEFYRVDEADNITVTDDLVNSGVIRVKFDIEFGTLKATLDDVEYEIVPRAISDCKFIYSKTVRYTGKEIVPVVSAYMLTENKKVIDLVENEDYTIDYKPDGRTNVYPGSAYVVVKANDSQGNFTGSKNLTFTIKPGTPSSPSVVSESSSTVKASWVRDVYSTGTTVDLCTTVNGTLRVLQSKKLTGKTYTFTGLDSATTYTVRFQSYVEVDKDGDGTKEQFVSDIVTRSVTTDLETTALTVTSTTKGKAKLSWKDSGSIANYKIYRSTDGKNYNKIATIPASTGGYTDSSLESGKTYYYYVIGYAIVNGTLTPCSSDPKVVTVKVK